MHASSAGLRSIRGEPQLDRRRPRLHHTDVARVAQEAALRFGPFITEWVNPGADERDARGAECAPEMMHRAAQVGLFTYALPEELGGRGADPFEWGIVLEQVGYLSEDSSFPALLSARVWLTEALFSTSRADLLDRYVRPMAKAEAFGAFAYSEDADPFSFSSTVRRDGDSVVVNGTKHIVTGATRADFFLVFVKDETTDDMVTVIVERDDDGVHVDPVETMGMRGLGLATLRMERVRVPAERLILDSDGITFAQRMLNSRRVLLVAGLVGAMRSLHEYCIDRLSQTRRYGVPLTEMQNVQAALGRQFVAIESSRAILHRGLSVLSGHEDGLDPSFDPVISAAKHEIANHGVEIALSALRLLGGRGYLRGRAERFLRDSCSLLAAAGTQDVLEIDLGNRAVADVTWPPQLRAVVGPAGTVR